MDGRWALDDGDEIIDRCETSNPGFIKWLDDWQGRFQDGAMVSVLMDQKYTHAIVLDILPRMHGIVVGQRKLQGARVSTQTTQEKIAQADERLAKMQKHQAMLRRVAVAEAEIPAAYNTGQVSMEKLGEQYGISSMTVKRILNGVGITPKGARRLTQEQVQEVSALILAGHSRGDLAQHYGVSEASIRTAGLKTGAYKKGERKPHRTDEEYELIEQWDKETRSRFGGAGLLSLGNGLRDWQRKRANKALADANIADPPAEEKVEDPSEPQNDGEPVPTNDAPATTEDFEASTPAEDVSNLKF